MHPAESVNNKGEGGVREEKTDMNMGRTLETWQSPGVHVAMLFENTPHQWQPTVPNALVAYLSIRGIASGVPG